MLFHRPQCLEDLLDNSSVRVTFSVGTCRYKGRPIIVAEKPSARYMYVLRLGRLTYPRSLSRRGPQHLRAAARRYEHAGKNTRTPSIINRHLDLVFIVLRNRLLCVLPYTRGNAQRNVSFNGLLLGFQSLPPRARELATV